MPGAEWFAVMSSPWALAAMAALVYADAFLVIVPGEAAVTAMGAVAASTGTPPLIAVIAVAALAAFCGDLSCYAIGRAFGTRWLHRPRLRRALDRAAVELRRRGAVILFTARFIPFARLAVNLAAGAARTPLFPYLLLACAAATGWALVQALLGAVVSAVIPGGPLVAVVVSVAVAVAIGAGLDALLALFRRRRARRMMGDSTAVADCSQVNGNPGSAAPMTTEIDDHRAIAEIKERLAGRFPDRSAAEISAVVDEVYASHGEAKVRDFVPVLVEKAAKKQLKKS